MTILRAAATTVLNEAATSLKAITEANYLHAEIDQSKDDIWDRVTAAMWEPPVLVEQNHPE